MSQKNNKNKVKREKRKSKANKRIQDPVFKISKRTILNYTMKRSHFGKGYDTVFGIVVAAVLLVQTSLNSYLQ